MKVAVSIPDPVFAQAEGLARRLKLPRSKLYARALDAYVASHDADRLTAAANALADELGDAPDPFVREAGRRALRHIEW